MTPSCRIRNRVEGRGLPWVVQWLRLHTSNAGYGGSIPGQGTKIPHAARCSQKQNKNHVAGVRGQPHDWAQGPWVLVGTWLGPVLSLARPIPGWGTKILHAIECGAAKKKKKNFFPNSAPALFSPHTLYPDC